MNIEPARAELSNIEIRNYLIALHLRRGKTGYTLHVAIICVCGVSTQQIIIIILIKTPLHQGEDGPAAHYHIQIGRFGL